MKRKILSGFLAAAIMLMSTCGHAVGTCAAAESTASEAAVASAAEAAAESAAEAAEESAEEAAESAAEAAEESAEEAAESAAEAAAAEGGWDDPESAEGDGLSQEEFIKNIDAIEELLRSEDLRHLLTYREVQDLLDEIIRDVVIFHDTEPDLFAKILETFGLKERYVNLIMTCLAVIETAGSELEAYLETEEGMKLNEDVKELLRTPEAVNKLLDIYALMLEEGVSAVGTAAESEGTRQLLELIKQVNVEEIA